MAKLEQYIYNQDGNINNTHDWLCSTERQEKKLHKYRIKKHLEKTRSQINMVRATSNSLQLAMGDVEPHLIHVSGSPGVSSPNRMSIHSAFLHSASV